jgi:hypothetical protein
MYFAAFMLSVGCDCAFAQWTPPGHPDPMVILPEAWADARAGRFSDALAKHVWIHHHALAFDPEFSGARLSFAIVAWVDLAKRYPQAMDALDAERNLALQAVLNGHGKRDDFAVYSRINQYKSELAATADLFIWLDENNPALAREVYTFAQRALVTSRNYRLCGNYMNPSEDTRNMVERYQFTQRMSREEGMEADIEKFSRMAFSNEAAVLVALLAVNGKKSEADEVMDVVLKALPDETFRKELQTAKAGVVPVQWQDTYPFSLQ